MSEVLEIAQLGNPILRKTAEKIEKIDEEIISLSSDMTHTVKNVHGVGLAAPQVFESKSMFIMASQPNERYPDAPEMEPTVVINPKIIVSSDEIVKDWEGCLSIPGIRGFVPRAREIEVEFTDINGKNHKTSFDNFAARIFQHEFDHLHGRVFLDRVDSTHDIITERVYFELLSSLK